MRKLDFDRFAQWDRTALLNWEMQSKSRSAARRREEAEETKKARRAQEALPRPAVTTLAHRVRLQRRGAA